MGTVARALERLAPRSRAGRLAWGAVMAVGLPAAFGGGALLLLEGLPGAWSAVVAAYLLWSSLAIRGLADAGRRMAEALESGDLGAARDRLSWLCSRDPSDLAAEDLAAATVESVAENASDSIVAPLFWFALLGVPGAVAYRAVNTLDAMIGYRDARYEHLGKAAARLDDLANLVPARLTAAILLLVCRGRGLPVWRRDARATSSPNAGHPMAAMAGTLGVRLEKRGEYALGDVGDPVGPAHVRRAVALLWRIAAAACLLAAAAVAARGVPA